MDKALVTGGTGFVGYWMKQTQPEGIEGFYWNRPQYDHDWWEVFGHWKYIVHLAPVSPARVLYHAKGRKCRVLYASSGIVYHPENNIEYRRQKLQWELDCIHSGVDVVIARLFTFYGEKLDDNKAWTQFTKAAKAGEPQRIWGDGRAVRSYMHGAEMARWLWAILLRGENGQAYDVGSDKPITMLELARDIRDEHNSKSGVIVENRIPDPMPVYLPVDTAKTRKLLK